MRIIAAVSAVLILGTTGVGVGVAADAHHGPVPAWEKIPCAQEDSDGPCYWDAGSAGNGRGHSFWVIPAHVDGRLVECVTYWNASYNRRHGECVAPTED